MESSSRSRTLDGDFKLTITCPVCYNYFKEPVQFPACCHSLCRGCMVKLPITAGSLSCPTCRVSSSASLSSIKGFKVNAVVQQIVEMVEATERSDNAAASHSKNDRLPMFHHCDHILLSGSKSICTHCKEHFCHACMIVHLEIMRQRMASLHHQWNSALSSQLKKKMTLAEQKVLSQIESIEMEVQLEADAAIEAFREIVQAKVRTMANESKDLGLKFIGDLREATNMIRDEDMKLKERLDNLMKQSLISENLKSGDIVDLYQRMERAEEQMGTLEKVVSEKFGLKFHSDHDLEKRVSVIFEEEVQIGKVSAIEMPAESCPDNARQTPTTSTTLSGCEAGTPSSVVVDRGPFIANVKLVSSTSEIGGEIDLRMCGMAHMGARNAAVLLQKKAIGVFSMNSSFPMKNFVVPHVECDGSKKSQALHEYHFQQLVLLSNRAFVLDSARKCLQCFDFIFQCSNAAPKASYGVLKMLKSGHFNGIAAVRDSNQLCTIINDQMFIFEFRKHTLEERFCCKVVAPKSRVLAADNNYGICYAVLSTTDTNNPYKLHVKQPISHESGSQWPASVTPEEAIPVDMPHPMKGSVISAVMDNHGHLFVVDDSKPFIRVLKIGRQDRNFHFVGIICTESFAPIQSTAFRPIVIDLFETTQTPKPATSLAVLQKNLKKIVVIEIDHSSVSSITPDQ